MNALELDEWAVLGSMARGGAFACSEVSALLSPEDFTETALGKAYSVLLQIAETHPKIDRTQFTAALNSAIRTGPAASSEIVTRIFDSVVTDSNALWYAQRIKDRSVMLQSRGLLESLAQQGRAWDGSAAEFVEEAQRQVFAIDAAIPEQKDTDTATIVPPWKHSLREEYDNPQNSKAIDPGLPTLKRFLGGGFQGGRLYVVAARPGRGKTTLTVQMGVAAARMQNEYFRNGVHVHFFSLEMYQRELLNLMAFSAAEVNFSLYKERQMTEDQWRRVDAAADWLACLPINIHDDRSITLPRLLSVCRRAKFAGKLDMIVIDYLQLLESGKTGKNAPENRNQEVTQISRALQKLAGELDVPIILISQLNRTIERRADGVPMLSDLRESGSIEQDAYTVAFIHEDKEEARGIAPPPGSTATPADSDPFANGESFILDIKKNRSGEEGRIPLIFWKRIGKLGEAFRGEF